MNNECERVGLPVPRITDNGFMVKVIFKRPSADGYKKDTVTLEKDTVNLENDTVASKKDTVEHQLKTKKTPAEHQLNTSRTPVEHQLGINQATNGDYDIKLVKLVKLIGENWYSSLELRELLGFKSKSSFIKNYLTPAIEGGYVKYEDPSNPTSPNQRYGLTVKGKAIYYSQKY